ncbi:MAG: hypothetical protein OEV40_23280 [Acidimicrobiia bacterium]|nr:hypothetical protein [Acidimicrobiia bacterium]
MSGQLVGAFPLLVAAAVVTVVVLIVRLDRRMSRGAHSAGARHREPPTHPGQRPTPWELQTLDDQLQLGRARMSTGVPRSDVTATVNRLLMAAGFDDARDHLPLAADEAQLAAAVTRIEERLGLAPLDTPGSQAAASGQDRTIGATSEGTTPR